MSRILGDPHVEGYTTNFTLVGEFMSAMGQDVNTRPVIPDLKIQSLRYNLIAEELAELYEAQTHNDLVGIADALTDLLYVVYGSGHAYGINLDACFEEVHRSNMTKLGPDGRAIKNEAGKVMKPDTYTPPNLESILGL